MKKNFILLLLSIVFSPLVKSQNFTLRVENDSLVSSSVYEFDVTVYITTTSGSFESGYIRLNIGVNNAWRNGGTITPSIVSGRSEWQSAQEPISNVFDATVSPNQLRINSNTVTSGNGTTIGEAGKRYIRVRLTNSTNFASGVSPNFTFVNTGSDFTKLNKFVAGVQTEIVGTSTGLASCLTPVYCNAGTFTEARISTRDLVFNSGYTGTNTFSLARNLIVHKDASAVLGANTLRGNIINNGTLNLDSLSGGLGLLKSSGVGGQSISGNPVIVSGLSISSYPIDLNTQLIIRGSCTTFGSGTINSNGNLYFSSTSANQGVTSSGITINGTVTVERRIPGGRRAFRILSHPFSTSQGLNAITDELDITGSGGSTNGFTNSGTNAPSAFWFDQSIADNSTSGNNPGWVAFTNTNGSGSNSWDKGEAIRVLVRGSKGEGLNGNPYTPSATVLAMSGNLNNGNQTLNFTKGASSDYILVGNPFISNFPLSTTTRTNIGANYYVWNANSGLRGAYVTYAFSTNSIYLPAFGGFITTLTSSTGSIVFPEANRSTSSPFNLFKTNQTNTLTLALDDQNGTNWDKWDLQLDDNKTDGLDFEDANKLLNPDLSFYSKNTNGGNLAIDWRPFADNKTIAISLATTLDLSLMMKIENLNIPSGKHLFLVDHFLNTTQEINDTNFTYSFNTNSNPLSKGDARFEIMMTSKPTYVHESINTLPSIMLAPNPAKNNLNIYFGKGFSNKIDVKIHNLVGEVVFENNSQNPINGQIEIMNLNLPSGTYLVQVNDQTSMAVKKLVIQ